MTQKLWIGDVMSAVKIDIAGVETAVQVHKQNILKITYEFRQFTLSAMHDLVFGVWNTPDFSVKKINRSSYRQLSLFSQ